MLGLFSQAGQFKQTEEVSIGLSGVAIFRVTVEDFYLEPALLSEATFWCAST